MESILSVRLIARKNKVTNGHIVIRLKFGLDQQYGEISTRVKCPVQLWDQNAEKAVGKSINVKSINKQLQEFKMNFIQHYNKLKFEEEVVDIHKLRDSLKKNKSKGKTLMAALQEFLNLQERLVGIEKAIATYRRYTYLETKLTGYLKFQYKQGDIPFTSLNHQFLDNFEIYLKSELKIGHNTAIKYLQLTKTVVKYAIRIGWIQFDPFIGYKCSKKPVPRTCLTLEEVHNIEYKEIGIERLEEVRDIFIFCCYSGYAYSDVADLTEDNLVKGIDRNWWMNTTRKKTKIQANVPLLPPALKIIEKYKNHPEREIKGKLLPVRSNQKMNAYLKEIATICNIDKHLTTHLARHTFATTILLSNGVPIESVSKMLGHTNLRTTQIYAKVLQHKVSNDMETLKGKLFSSDQDLKKESI